MGNTEATYYRFLDKFLDFLAGNHGQRFGFCSLSEVVAATTVYLNTGHAVGIGPIKSIPQTAKSHGEVIEVSLFGYDLGMLENL